MWVMFIAISVCVIAILIDAIIHIMNHRFYSASVAAVVVIMLLVLLVILVYR